MSIQITDVCIAGAATHSFPEKQRDEALLHWRRVTDNPRTQYAQLVDRGEITNRYSPHHDYA